MDACRSFTAAESRCSGLASFEEWNGQVTVCFWQNHQNRQKRQNRCLEPDGAAQKNEEDGVAR